MSTVHEADKNNVKVKSFSYGELNCDGLHILITFIYAHIGAYHYSTAYILHPHIHRRTGPGIRGAVDSPPIRADHTTFIRAKDIYSGKIQHICLTNCVTERNKT